VLVEIADDRFDASRFALGRSLHLSSSLATDLLDGKTA
jgi:hypothetical protein